MALRQAGVALACRLAACPAPSGLAGSAALPGLLLGCDAALLQLQRHYFRLTKAYFWLKFIF